MAESKPIQADDIVAPDVLLGYIAQAQKALEVSNQLTEAFKQMLAAQGKKLPSTIPQSTKEMEEFYNAIKKVQDAENGLTTAQKAQIQAQVKINDLKKQYRNALKEQTIAESSATDSINALGVAYKKANAELNAMSMSDPGFKKKQVEVKDLHDRLNKLNEATGKYTMNVGNYAKALQGATGITHIFGEALGFNREILDVLRASHSALREGLRDTHHLMEGLSEKIKGNTEAAKSAGVANEAVGATWIEMLGPIGLAIAAIGLITAGLITYAFVSASAKKAEEERSKAVDGTIIVEKDLRDSFNETLLIQQKINDQWKVMAGEMDEVEAKYDELRFKNKIAMADLANETEEKVQKVTAWYHVLWNAIIGGNPVDAAKRQMEEEGKILQEHMIKAGKISAEQQAINQEEIMELERTHRKKIVDEIDFNSKMQEIKNEARKNEQEKEIEQLNIERRRELSKITANSTGDIGTDNTARERIEEETEAKILNIRKKYIEEALERQYEYNIKLAQLTNSKEEIAKSEYDKELYDLNKNLIAKNASEKESVEARTILYQEYQQKLEDIQNARKEKDLEIQLSEDLEIQNNFSKEIALAQDNYNKSLFDLNIQLKKKIITQEQYNKESEDLEKTHQQRLQDIQNKSIDQNLNDLFRKAELHTKSDTIAGAKPKTIREDEIEQEAARWKAEWTKLSQDANTTYQQMENAYQNHQNILNEINRKAAEERAKEIEKAEKAALTAISQALEASNQLKQDALKTETQQLATEADVQAQLAASGRKNTLDQTLAAQARASEQEKQLQRQEQREKNAEALAELFLSAEQAYLKSGVKPEQAALEAMTTVATAKGISQGIAGALFKGTADTGGPGNLDNKGGRLWILHPHEAVINKEKNEMYPGLSQAMLDGKAHVWFQKKYLPKLNYNHTYSFDRVTEAVHSLKEDLNNVKQAVIDKKEVTYMANEEGELVKKVVEKGVTQFIIKKDSPTIKIM